MNTTHFTLAYWCILVAALLPIACAGIAKSGKFKQSRREGGYDNHNPRAWLAKQTDWRARANAAQANSFEALPFFIGAVLVAHQLGANQTLVDLLALLFIVARILYVMLYLADNAKLRSTVWTIGLALNVGILFAGFR
ncbi:MAG: glutathione metabolism protein [Rhodoferax sp.]|nr:MAG: glutathione metabolism protein [Rhodoferax sp.]